MPDEKATEIEMAGGKVTSSDIPELHLLPTEFLVRTAERCTLGIKRKGADKAWNATSKNQEILGDVAFLINRLGHVVYHSNKLRDKLAFGRPLLASDDDAAAIAWGGMLACCATRVIEDNKSRPLCHACGGTGIMGRGLRDGEQCPACHGAKYLTHAKG